MGDYDVGSATYFVTDDDVEDYMQYSPEDALAPLPTTQRWGSDDTKN